QNYRPMGPRCLKKGIAACGNHSDPCVAARDIGAPGVTHAQHRFFRSHRLCSGSHAIVAVSFGGLAMSLTYSLTEAARRLGISRRWLQNFLRDEPVDKNGSPFYVLFGRRKRFNERDLERIIETLRDQERQKLESSQSRLKPFAPEISKDNVEELK